MPSTSRLWTSAEICEFLAKKTDGDVFFYLAVADWQDGSFDAMGFNNFPKDHDIPVTLVCNLSRGRCSFVEIEKLLARGAKVFDSKALTGSVWALTIPNEEATLLDRYSSMDFPYCGTLSTDFVSSVGVAGPRVPELLRNGESEDFVTDLAVIFDDPFAHQECMEFIIRRRNEAGDFVTLKALQDVVTSSILSVPTISSTRSILHQVRFEPPRDSDVIPFTIEMWLDTQGKPATNRVTLGVKGGMSRKDSEYVQPFLLHPNGIIDFGTDMADEDREVKTNLLSGKPVKVGEYFTLWWPEGEDGEVTYRVSQVNLLM